MLLIGNCYLINLPIDLLDYISNYLKLDEIVLLRSTSNPFFNQKMSYYNKLFNKEIKKALYLKYKLYHKLRLPIHKDIIIYESDTYLIIKPKSKSKY